MDELNEMVQYSDELYSTAKELNNYVCIFKFNLITMTVNMLMKYLPDSARFCRCTDSKYACRKWHNAEDPFGLFQTITAPHRQLQSGFSLGLIPSQSRL